MLRLSRLVLCAAAALLATGAAPRPKASTLATPEQLAKEKLALQMFASAPVQRAMAGVRSAYDKDKIADMPGGHATADAAARAMAMYAVELAVNTDTDRPVAFWATNATHTWHGMTIPRSGIVQDNPDNVYRTIPVDGAARYEILGRVKGQPPAQETFVVHTTISGDTPTPQLREHEAEASSVALDKIPVAADGTFRITVDSSPANGRLDHLQVPADARHGYIIVRDSLSDWATQTPVALKVRRIDGPPVKPAPTLAALSARAAELTQRSGAYWLAWEHRVFFDRPVNTFSLSFARVTGWGSIKCGYYRLGSGEALLMTLERRDAAYLSVQTADLWGPARNYVTRTGSLNQAQAKANADGTYSYVLSVADPGVYNWLDPDGLSAGTFCARWQGIKPGFTDEGAVRELRVVKLKDLKASLPAGAASVTTDERRAQLAQRVAAYNRRLTE